MREWFAVYSNKPSLLNYVNQKLDLLSMQSSMQSHMHNHSGGKPRLFRIIKHFAISLNLKNIL